MKPLRKAVRALWGSCGAAVVGLDTIAHHTDPAGPPPGTCAPRTPLRQGRARTGRLHAPDRRAGGAGGGPGGRSGARGDPGRAANAYWAPFETADYDQLAAGLFERVEHRGATRLGLTLTPEAQRYRVAAVPPQVVDLVGGEGLEPPTSSV